jgi:hypothetical protein
VRHSLLKAARAADALYSTIVVGEAIAAPVDAQRA